MPGREGRYRRTPCMKIARRRRSRIRPRSLLARRRSSERRKTSIWGAFASPVYASGRLVSGKPSGSVSVHGAKSTESSLSPRTVQRAAMIGPHVHARTSSHRSPASIRAFRGRVGEVPASGRHSSHDPALRSTPRASGGVQLSDGRSFFVELSTIQGRTARWIGGYGAYASGAGRRD